MAHALMAMAKAGLERARDGDEPKGAPLAKAKRTEEATGMCVSNLEQHITALQSQVARATLGTQAESDIEDDFADFKSKAQMEQHKRSSNLPSGKGKGGESAAVAPTIKNIGPIATTQSRNISTDPLVEIIPPTSPTAPFSAPTQTAHQQHQQSTANAAAGSGGKVSTRQRRANQSSGNNGNNEGDTVVEIDGKKVAVSAEAFVKLTLYTAQIGLSASLAAKIAKQLSITPLNTTWALGFHELTLSAKRVYSTLLRGESEETRARAAAVHTVVFGALVEWLETKVPNDAALKEYNAEIEKQNEAHRLLWIGKQVKYTRTRRAWKRGRVIVEMCVAPSSLAEAVWLLFMRTCTELEPTTYEAHGLAPKSGSERAVEKILKDLGMWKTGHE